MFNVNPFTLCLRVPGLSTLLLWATLLCNVPYKPLILVPTRIVGEPTWDAHIPMKYDGHYWVRPSWKRSLIMFGVVVCGGDILIGEFQEWLPPLKYDWQPYFTTN